MLNEEADNGFSILLFYFSLYSWDKEIKKAKLNWPQREKRQALNWGTSIPVFLSCIMVKDSDHFSTYLARRTCVMT